jgi:hypothetical protein
MNDIVDFEKNIHLANVSFVSVRAYTEVVDTNPYNGDEFISQPLEGKGYMNEAPGDLLLPLQFCLKVKRRTTSGRSGTLLYRGILTENNVSGGTGSPVLVDLEGWRGRWHQAVSQSRLGDLFVGDTMEGNDFAFVMPHIPGSTKARYVQGFDLLGATVARLNRKRKKRVEGSKQSSTT